MADWRDITPAYRVHVWEAERGRAEYRACIVGGPHWAGTAHAMEDALAEIRLGVLHCLNGGTCDHDSGMRLICWTERMKRELRAQKLARMGRTVRRSNAFR